MNKIYQKPFPGEKNAGFTLIELLVVILIIGILSAVALPQYRKTVDKARFQEVLLLARDLYHANQRRMLETGSAEIALWNELDIGSPAGFTPEENGKWRKQYASHYISVYKVSDEIAYVYWYPSGKDMNLSIKLREPFRGVRCAYHNDDYVKKLCEAFGANSSNKWTLFK